METIIHNNVKLSANVKDLIKDQHGKHIIHYTNGKKRVLTVNLQKNMTEQAHAKECDMNYILRKYQKTGLIEHVKKHQGRYDDITVTDFTEAMHKVSEAQDMFNELPSFVKKKVGGSVEKFLEFVQNPNNKADMQRLGMLKGNDGLNAKGEPVASPQADPSSEGGSEPQA